MNPGPRPSSPDSRLLFGPVAGCVLALAVAGLGLMVPGYSQVRQTVSEIGEVGSPARIPFTIALCAVGLCVFLFAIAIRDRCLQAGTSRWSAYLIGFMAFPAAGVGVFAFPHPLHNVFGLSEIVGYQAPLALALTWRRRAEKRIPVVVSWIAWVLVWMSVGLNMTSMDRHGALWGLVGPRFGLVQRALFASWFGWCAVLGILEFLSARSASLAGEQGGRLGRP
jgi:hypothetical membrane protein